VASALIAVSALFTIIYLFKIPGMIVLCYLASIAGIYEMSKLLFRASAPAFARVVFFAWTTIFYSYLANSHFSNHFYEIVVSIFMVTVIIGVFYHKKFESIDAAFAFMGKFLVGLIYSASLPALILSILRTENTGILWFLCLLTVVFAGDIGAYLFGTLFGKTKIAPLLSPKKSLQGSLGGLLFSSLAGLAFSYIIPDAPILIMAGLGFFGGALGQIGDFFESLIKRLAGVKDSGSIMPGHGGVLDRLDGVYFASPLFYLAVNYII
jgi:phosphatidate cytidylyltransferase